MDNFNFTVGKFKLRVKPQVDPFEFNAFRIVYARGLNDNDQATLAKAYHTMCSWVECELSEGKWSPVWDTSTKKFVIPELNSIQVVTEIIDQVTNGFVIPLFQSTNG